MLYLRMIVSVIVSLYTSRVVLATLGVEDYGIYSAVAGVIGMIAFLNTSMSSASARFITFYLGQGDTTMLKRTFSSAVTVHLLLAVFMTVIFETAGVWYVNNMLVLPEGSLTAANWVFQFAVISMFICIVQSPYAGAVIAYESMDFYACMEIVNVILKLLIVYMLLVFDCNKLILYSALTLMISAVSFGCYTFYVTTRFKDCRLSSRPDRETVKSLLSFSGFDLFGNMSNAVGVQGYALVLNYFLGAAVNAANGIAILVQGDPEGIRFQHRSCVQATDNQTIRLSDNRRPSAIDQNSHRLYTVHVSHSCDTIDFRSPLCLEPMAWQCTAVHCRDDPHHSHCDCV